MPIYTFECLKCEKSFDELRNLKDFSSTSTCPECGSVAKKLVTAFSPAIFKPYTHYNLAKDPVHIKSKKQERHEFESRNLADAR